MDVRHYATLDATDLARLVRAREVSAAELHEVAVAAIEAVEPVLDAVVDGPYDEVEFAAQGPLAGVPFAMKDTLVEAGRPLGFGTALLEGFVAKRDGTLARRFREAGLQSVVRSACPEFAFNFDTAPRIREATRNPWNPERSPGGSSGGAAALVASGALPLAHANDGGGSIRIPAAFCGLVGLKPSRGRVPLGPAVGEAVGGFAHEFAVTRTVRDAALLLECVSGPAPGDRYYVAPYSHTASDRPLRIAVHSDSFDPDGPPTDAAIKQAVLDTARALEAIGHTVEEACPRLDAEALKRCCELIWSVDLAGLAHSFSRLAGHAIGPETVEAASLACIRRGEQATALEFASAQATVNSASRRWGAFLDDYDAFLCPTVPMTAPPSGWPAQDDPEYATARDWIEDLFPAIPFTPVANLTGQPSISLPLAESDEGMPIGVMLTAQTLREDLLLTLAADLEQAMPWRDRRPAISAG